jgi:hypothetical protein
MSPPSSGPKSKPSKKPAEAGRKIVKPTTTNIPVNRMARRLDGNIGKCAVVGSVTARGYRWEGWVGIAAWDFFTWPQYSKQMPLRATSSWTCAFTLLSVVYMFINILF